MAEATAAPKRWIRAAVIRAMDQGESLVLLGRDGAARKLEGDSAALVRALLAFFWAPRTHAEVVAHVAELTGGPVAATGPIDDALALLRQCDALREATPATVAPTGPSTGLRGARVVLGLTGAIASMHAPAWVSLLLQHGCDVQVVTTRKALRFVRAEALAALTHREVVGSVWQSLPGKPAPHIALATWADLMVVCPASATTLSRLATGNFADVVSAIALTTSAPVVVAPSMNPRMYQSAAVQRNLETLRGDGFHLVYPAMGIEVADAPTARTPTFGPSPPFDVVLDLARLVLVRPVARPPANAEEWNQLYRAHAPSSLPWTRETVDPDFAALFDRVVKPGVRVLDAGAGHGVMAREIARRGGQVVAVDVAAAALDVARAAPDAEGVTWVRGDVVTDVRGGAFDLVVDRGCLHVLPCERHGDYVAAMAHALRPGGLLAVKVHALEVTEHLGTVRFDPDALVARFAPAFDAVEITPSSIPGPGAQATPAWLGVFRLKK